MAGRRAIGLNCIHGRADLLVCVGKEVVVGLSLPRSLLARSLQPRACYIAGPKIFAR